MSFSMKYTKRNSLRNKSVSEKLAEQIDLTPVKLQNHGDKFVYHATQLPINIQNVQPKSTDEYLLGKPAYEKEELVYDASSKIWKLVPESELYKYK